MDFHLSIIVEEHHIVICQFLNAFMDPRQSKPENILQ